MPIAFTHETPGFYQLWEIYDSITNSSSGKIIPRVGSGVLDPSNGALFYVVAVSPVTYNSELGPVLTTLVAPDAPPTDNPDLTSVIDYGNSRFYLFYDTSERPTRLKIDKKVIVLGDDSQTYEVMKYSAENDSYVPISLYFDTDGDYRGTRIPLEEITGTVNARIPTDSHTSIELVDEEVFYMFVYDYAGVQCGSVKLYAKKALISNISDGLEIIEGFDIEGTQRNALGLYIYQDQDPDSLVIRAKLTYNTGKVRNLAIDNELVHLYGLAGFTPSYPGQEVSILVKYFLGDYQQAAGDFVDSVSGVRFLYKRERLIVRAQDGSEYKMKILTVPRYNQATGTYFLMFFLYRIQDGSVREITHLVQISPGFDGTDMSSAQEVHLTFRIRDVFPDSPVDQEYQQNVIVRLAPYSFYERYILQDDKANSYAIYGVDSPVLARPVLYYDSAVSQYLLPTSKFPNVRQLLEAFYYKNAPLYDSQWLVEPVVPTHFTLRDPATGGVIVGSPILIENYALPFSAVGSVSGSLVGTNVIVEFLKQNGAQFDVLWGSPVDVIAIT